MATNRYVGARYVPLIMGDWDNTQAYEALSVVIYQGDSYISKIPVPAGAQITNTTYWVKCADYNAQWAAFQQNWVEFQTNFESRFVIFEGTVTTTASGDNTITIDQAALTAKGIAKGSLKKYAPISIDIGMPSNGYETHVQTGWALKTDESLESRNHAFPYLRWQTVEAASTNNDTLLLHYYNIYPQGDLFTVNYRIVLYKVAE